MASLVTHGVAAATLGALVPLQCKGARFWVVSVICSLTPDIDVAGLWLGIPYDALLGHRGLTHSLAFAVLFAAAVVRYGALRTTEQERLRLTGYLALVTASHGVLDAMTDGGLGVAFFAPFDHARFFLPWRPLVVSPIGVQPFISGQGVAVLWSEALWIWLPAGCLVATWKLAPWLGSRLRGGDDDGGRA